MKSSHRLDRLHMNQLRIFLTLFFLASSIATTMADWPNWRGLDGSGSINEGSFPAILDDSTLDWTFPLPGKGCSTPVIFANHIFVTAPENGRDGLTAIAKDGTKKWSVTFGNENPGKHRNGSGSNPSACVDSSGIYVYYKSGTLAAVEFDGSIKFHCS